MNTSRRGDESHRRRRRRHCAVILSVPDERDEKQLSLHDQYRCCLLKPNCDLTNIQNRGGHRQLALSEVDRSARWIATCVRRMENPTAMAYHCEHAAPVVMVAGPRVSDRCRHKPSARASAAAFKADRGDEHVADFRSGNRARRKLLNYRAAYSPAGGLTTLRRCATGRTL